MVNFGLNLTPPSPPPQAERLLQDITTKFDGISAQIKENKDAGPLLAQISDRFKTIESKIQAAVAMQDRITRLEAKHEGHYDRINRLESRHEGHHDRLNRLEANGGVDPEQEAIIRRINSKLDDIEASRRLGANLDPRGSRTLGARSEPARTLDDDEDEFEDKHAARIAELQSRVEKLQMLKAKYEREERA